MPGSTTSDFTPVSTDNQDKDTANSSAKYAAAPAQGREIPRPKVVVCAGNSTSTGRVIPHAMTLSKALGAELLLVHVMEPQPPAYTPFDPFEWDLRRREAEAFVAEVAKLYSTDERGIATQVLQGRSSEQICACVVDNVQDIAALCRSDVETPGHIGNTARRVLERATSSVLVVPPTAPEGQPARYQRLLVPLDGSARAESAVSFARKIALAEQAEIVLVHAIPDPVMTEVGPLESEEIELKERLTRRNEGVARDYLERIREQLRGADLQVRCLILTGGDARRLLTSAIVTEAADLLVMSSHGNSGYANVSAGDFASYILAHSSVPVLMIRRQTDTSHGHVYRGAESKGVRRPAGAL